MKRLMMVVAPLVIVAAGVVGAVAMIASKKTPETQVPEAIAPLVRVQAVELGDVQLTVHSQGTVSPRTESLLLPEVAGRVVEVAGEFASGGFFEKGEMLLRIDPSDFREAVVRAESAVTAARLRLAREQVEAEIAIEEWQDLHGDEPAPPLTRREPQVEDARAALRAAEASLEQARRNLERTTIRAPYACRVREKSADVGTYVSPGTPLGRIYAIDYAEIRLPIPDEDLAFIDLPLVFREDTGGGGQGPPVTLIAEFAGETHRWQGRVVRTEGEIDPRSRLVHVVARVPNPYGRGRDPDRPPLAVGLYVRAEIQGNLVRDVAVVPRAALRPDGRIMVVDDEDRLRFVDVGLVRTTRETAIIGSGLSEGDRVVLSTIATATDGMRVRTTPEPASAS